MTCYCILGVLWPLEGLPQGIRWVSNLMPVTYAVIAVKAVVSKGITALSNDCMVYAVLWLCRYGNR